MLRTMNNKKKHERFFNVVSPLQTKEFLEAGKVLCVGNSVETILGTELPTCFLTLDMDFWRVSVFLDNPVNESTHFMDEL
ncbi:hypothetical protein Y032_0007g3302 [Ancylostoma ceylanicum]|uniref:Uncharacterized protein n=1 Tax=Ancylostoma ceylanicum TaxID=53326 RepID=A0A016VLY4_9BILA|nr:hypothetical protein Y032_0007g3302 [Ancylostoma ceylanicum]